MTRKWYLFRFAHRFERDIEFQCRRLGVEMLYPLYVDWRKCGRDRKERPFKVPLFRGYMILGLDRPPSEMLEPILGMHKSVLPVFMTSGRGLALARASACDVAKLQSNKALFKSDGKKMFDRAEPDIQYTEGEVVRILGGLLSGQGGQIKRINSQSNLLKIGVKIDETRELDVVVPANVVERVDDAA